MNVEYFAKEFVKSFPEYEDYYKEDIKLYGELLGHLFFAAVLTSPLMNLLKENKNVEEIRKYIAFLEAMWEIGDHNVQNIVGVSILENFGDDETVLKNAYSYLSEELIRASKSLEEGLGRRKIHIFYRRGKVYADW